MKEQCIHITIRRKLDTSVLINHKKMMLSPEIGREHRLK